MRFSADERFLAYVVCEHRRGRSVTSILEDPYLCRLVDGRRRRLIAHPDVVRAVVADTAAARRAAGDAHPDA